MGYESILYVGRVTNNGISRGDGASPRWVDVEAIFEMGKLAWDDKWAELINSVEAPKRPEFFLYDPNDGNTEVTEDKYGENLKVLPFDDVIEALQIITAEEDCSPRAVAALAWLEAWPVRDYLTILHYGS